MAKTNRKFADGACDGCHPDRGVECRKGECAGGGNVTGDILVDPRENLLANGDFEAYAKEWNFNFAQESKILWSAIDAEGNVDKDANPRNVSKGSIVFNTYSDVVGNDNGEYYSGNVSQTIKTEMRSIP